MSENLDRLEKCILLMSSTASDAIVEQNQRRILDLMAAHKVDYIEIDGANPDNKEKRNELFNVSKSRGKYPQCFIEKEGNIRFIGLWEEIESLVENDSLPQEILSANPDMPTFNKIFSTVHRLSSPSLSLSLSVASPTDTAPTSLPPSQTQTQTQTGTQTDGQTPAETVSENLSNAQT
eukprot:CAMPEP_0182416614 /NCGR_PEP_ID=MMETSP1167-20130531/973_1 /TAXON_ID=2988 /ORGANISM="Mallomonas Sp, Strain CCMP3275" /LENGTH=177 /DNA_ID=CAMNT_0024589553 /DNA_START=85 /DNA_END=618 /DNA_ORIENTATION=+